MVHSNQAKSKRNKASKKQLQEKKQQAKRTRHNTTNHNTVSYNTENLGHDKNLNWWYLRVIVAMKYNCLLTPFNSASQSFLWYWICLFTAWFHIKHRYCEFWCNVAILNLETWNKHLECVRRTVLFFKFIFKTWIQSAPRSNRKEDEQRIEKHQLSTTTRFFPYFNLFPLDALKRRGKG